MIVREYRHEDLEQALNVDGRCPRRRVDKFRVLECSDAFYCYVAEDDRKMVGFIIMEDLGDDVSHYMVQVNVARKRHGIGSTLVQRVSEHIGPDGHISLNVNTDNEEAIAFYEALGFRRSGFTRGYRKGQDKYWFQLDL